MNHVVKAVFKGCGWAFFTSFLGWIRIYSKHPEKKPLKYRLGKLRKLSATIHSTLNAEIIEFGTENKLLDKTCCYFPNHLDLMDPLLVISTTGEKDIGFVAKKEMADMKFVRNVFYAIDGTLMDRQDLKQSLKVMNGVQKSLQEGEKSWVIFPEGTRLKDQNMLVQDFHYGSFKAAMKAKVPLVPVALFGTFRLLKTHPDHKYYPVLISYLDPIYPEEYEHMTTQEVAIMVRKKIQAEIMYHLRPLDQKLMMEKNKNYKSNTIY